MRPTIYYARELEGTSDVNNAAPKARQDIDDIFCDMGYTELVVEANSCIRSNSRAIDKLKAHFVALRQWNMACAPVSKGDILLMQFPPRNHSLLLWRLFNSVKKRGGHAVLLVHDLDSLRFQQAGSTPIHTRIRRSLEETSLLKKADYIITHNAKMAKIMTDSFGIDPNKLVSLDIFDYLAPGFSPKTTLVKADGKSAIVIAGNLDPRKAGYVYQLPQNIDFSLYGSNLDASGLGCNCEYKGSFPIDEIVKVISGSFGLVWDGPSAKTCTGDFGQYLKINNPHKTSLYLAAGLPVIVWSESAISTFVQEHGVGIAIDSLELLEAQLSAVSEEDYQLMRERALATGELLRSGYYTKRAVEEAVQQISACK